MPDAIRGRGSDGATYALYALLFGGAAMTDQPTFHTCARCGVADEDVISWTSGKRTTHEHLTPDLCAIAKLQRQSARRMELLLECHVALYDQAPEGGNCDALLARIEAEK